ncbi:colicin immunity protein [Rheinheimera riviphila]|uniref:Colicin immunity protein n=1 Tax=Rheinheimera riviphila TaxID=1834037 RepID=A0A437QLX2_9GAMM|nr:colicin immunity protein [Rheinheimera riviphila]RVU35518.1 colicin immunity protein [Rheinheimera riviphila]
MTLQRDFLYNDSNLFFELNGNNLMKLTPDAAIELCKCLVEKDVVVVCVEGGIWHNPGFESRLDAIWTGKKPPVSRTDLANNNNNAIKSIMEDREICNAFIISTLRNV